MHRINAGCCNHMKIRSVLKILVYEFLKLLLAVSGSALVDHGMFSFLDCFKYGAVNIASCVA